LVPTVDVGAKNNTVRAMTNFHTDRSVAAQASSTRVNIPNYASAAVKTEEIVASISAP
jgi:hypothetical protein